MCPNTPVRGKTIPLLLDFHQFIRAKLFRHKTHPDREKERERDGNDEFEQRNGFVDDTASASVFDAVQSWGLGLMGYPD